MTTMTATTEHTLHTRQSACNFLAGYAASLLSSGATCRRVKTNVGRLSTAFGIDTILTINTSDINICTAADPSLPTVSSSAVIPHAGVDFSLNSALSALSWDTLDNNLTLDAAIDRYNSILHHRRIGGPLLLVMVTMANVGFCRIFGGDWTSALIVAFATAIGFHIKNLLLHDHFDMRFVLILCAFISSVTGSCGYIFDITSTPEIALGTSVLYLIPGVLYLNSVCDLFDGHTVCAVGRIIQSTVMTICISLGLILGIGIMNLTTM